MDSLQRLFKLVLVYLVMARIVVGGDWPQFRGPNHDGRSPEKILDVWPERGPRRVWRIPTTAGFSSFAMSGGPVIGGIPSSDRVFTLISRELGGATREVCVAFDAASGKESWAQPIGVSLKRDARWRVLFSHASLHALASN